MGLEIIILLMSIIITGLAVWLLASKYYQKALNKLTEENLQLKSQAVLNENIVNEVKVAFSKIAQDSLKNQQEARSEEHTSELQSRE